MSTLSLNSRDITGEGGQGHRDGPLQHEGNLGEESYFLSPNPITIPRSKMVLMGIVKK